MDRFFVDTESKSADSQIISGEGYRITVLTSCLLRVESGAFCDEATQRVWYRAWEKPEYRVEKEGAVLRIITDKTTFFFNGKSKKIFKILLADGREVSNFRKGNLRGTRRTLDMTFGAVKLSKGLVSKNGVAVFDDSKSLILKGDDILPREKCKDLYYFAYGNNYRECIRALYELTGYTPLIPRFALGNWWSRYKAYTQEEYRSLMQEFLGRKIPVTVATIDMDWHWVNVIERFGKEAGVFYFNSLTDKLIYGRMPGWTGYSWNTDLFPDYKELLKWLNDKNFKVTLNLHPAQGVRFFEDRYEEFCKAVGQDPKSKAPVKFSLKSKEYTKAYFDVLLRPYQDEGVRFWWIDWQQGTRSDIEGLDPLWALNHYHTLDQTDEGKRALILSRYAGIGSHRYPLGFSGDSAINWQVLDFQPYMTSTATNVGYSWWSHDIGGHHMGYKDDELYLRWLQFGVFSPINRLHSTSNEFMGKEPWKCSKETERCAEAYLRLRHKLIPYIYSINYLTHTEGRALCEPMYYSYDCKEAYAVKNQYSFGTQLVCAPVTSHTSAKTKLAGAKLFVPQGERYTDIFTGRIYESGSYTVYRDIEDMPVFARAGAIIPLYSDCDTNDVSVNQSLDIWLYRGDGEFTLYEDDGETLKYLKGKQCFTTFRMREEGDKITLDISSSGDIKLISKPRKFTLMFKDIASAKVSVDGKRDKTTPDCVEIEYDGSPVKVVLEKCEHRQNGEYFVELVNLVSKYQLKTHVKTRLFKGLLKDREARIPRMSEDMSGPIKELRKICR